MSLLVDRDFAKIFDQRFRFRPFENLDIAAIQYPNVNLVAIPHGIVDLNTPRFTVTPVFLVNINCHAIGHQFAVSDIHIALILRRDAGCRMCDPHIEHFHVAALAAGNALVANVFYIRVCDTGL